VRPAGSVGVVVEAPTDATHSYLIRFTDGEETVLRRSQLSIRKHVLYAGLQEVGAELVDWNLFDRVIYRCVVGSRAYGLAGEESDLDRRGIYLPTAEMHWSLFGVPEQIEDKQRDEVFWELQKFLVLALKANPNVLECLYTPLVELAAPPAQELLTIRQAFLSKLAYQTYNGYVLSQFKSMERGLRNQGEIKWKHAMHLIRLLLSGITLLREGFVPVDIGPYREELLAIRRGEVCWDEVNAWRLDLHRQFDRALETSRLPDRPDYLRANRFLIEARRSVIQDRP
jgi:predicted nucleotidyltransferase